MMYQPVIAKNIHCFRIEKFSSVPCRPGYHDDWLLPHLWQPRGGERQSGEECQSHSSPILTQIGVRRWVFTFLREIGNSPAGCFKKFCGTEGSSCDRKKFARNLPSSFLRNYGHTGETQQLTRNESKKVSVLLLLLLGYNKSHMKIFITHLLALVWNIESIQK